MHINFKYNNKMNDTTSSFKVYSMMNTCQEDAFGASLTGRDLKMLKVAELQQWSQCRNISTKGKKAELVLW